MLGDPQGQCATDQTGSFESKVWCLKIIYEIGRSRDVSNDIVSFSLKYLIVDGKDGAEMNYFVFIISNL